MNGTKECIMCFSEIDTRAKKCPICKSVQNNYSNLESNSILMGIIALLFISFLIYLGYEAFFSSEVRIKSLKELKVTVTDISTVEERDTLYVTCIGTIDNKTSYKFTEPKYEVSFFSEKGKLIDTFSAEDDKITILPNKISNFRVRGIAQKSKNIYSICKVNITDAWTI